MKHLKRVIGLTVLSIFLLSAPQLSATSEDTKGSIAAKKVVEDYFKATRQQVFKLDDITSSQRAAVYSQRRAFLSSSEEGRIVICKSFYILIFTYFH